MGLLQLSVSFDRGLPAVYCPGENVSGWVTIVLEKPRKHDGVFVEMMGRAKVQWADGRSMVESDEIYFKSDVLLRQGDVELPAGRHRLHFNYLLPSGLPCSFEDHCGGVSYTATARIARPWRRDNTSVQTFTVTSVLDLTLDPDARDEVCRENQTNLCCLWCKSGPISARARLPRGGYCPGETLRVDAEVDNLSDVAVTVTATLEQEVEITYIEDGCFLGLSDEGRRTVVRELGVISGGDLPPGESLVWAGEPVTLPTSLVPTNLGSDFCNLIQVRYRIELVVTPHGPSLTELKLDLPLKVGTISPYGITLQHNSAIESVPPTYEDCMCDPPPYSTLFATSIDKSEL